MFTADAVQAIQTDALARHPQESCGLVVGGAYIPVPNRAQTPERCFRIDAGAVLEAGPALQAIVHSHPNGPHHPTAADMRSQIDTAVPWGLVATDGQAVTDVLWWGDGVPVPELVGRPFVHGITDCYALIRDYYRVERGITLPEFPRDDEWWKDGGDLYRDGFEAAGFRPIDESEARPGDVFLAAIRAPVPNHGGVLVEAGLALHHLPQRLSRREPVGPWLHHVSHWLRHRHAA